MFGWFKRQPESDNDQTLLRGAEVITDEFGWFVENDSDPLSIRDESLLPRQKSAIMMSLRLVYETAGDDEEQKAALVICALYLANFQKGVGNDPLHPPGAGALGLNLDTASSEELLSAVLGDPKNVERYNQFLPLVEAERQRIKQFFGM